MVYIKTLIIENFQSHKKTILKFDKGLNIITGPSDHGKSAVVRAIKWILYNEPKGFSYLRFGAKTSRVTIENNKGFTIIREKSKSKNRYIVKDDKGKETIYENFGNEIPEEVVKAHGIPKIVIDKDITSLVNISGQLELPFLIAESGYLKAKVLGRLTGIHVIDKAIKDAAVDLRKENQMKDIIDKDLNDLDVELSKYDFLDEYQKKINRLNQNISKIQILNKRLELIEKLNEDYKSNIYNLIEIDKKIKFYENILKVSKNIEKIEESNKKLNELKDLGTKFEKVNIDLIQVKTEYKNILVAVNFDKKYEFIKTFYEKFIKILEYYDKLNETKKYIDLQGSFINKVKDIEIIDSQNILELYNRYKYTDKVYTDYMENKKMIISVANQLEVIDTINNFDIKYKNLEEIYIKSKKLNEFRKSFLNLSEKIKKENNTINDLKKVSSFDINSEEMTKKLKSLSSAIEFNKKYKQSNKSIKEGKMFLQEKNMEIESSEKLLKEYFYKLGKCPFCKNKITDNNIDSVIKDFMEA